MTNVNGANGATHESPLPAVIATIATSDNGKGLHVSPERLQNIRELLSEPFDPSEIKWRVDRQNKSTVCDRHPQDAGGNVAYRFMSTFGWRQWQQAGRAEARL